MGSLVTRKLDALLDGIYDQYQYDFRNYTRCSLERRVNQALLALKCRDLDALHDSVLRDPATFTKLLSYLTVQVSDLFRDPTYWRALRSSVLPHLASYPRLRLWVAGCASGEEAYSLAIVLRELGLLERSQIYATDIESGSLRAAQSGVFPLDRIRAFSRNYFDAGGSASLSEYYVTAYSHAAFVPELRQRILFADHSLATDSAFAEVQLVSCRNVLIYFDRELQERAIELFRNALCPLGFLGLGARESLLRSANARCLEAFLPAERIYRSRRAS